MRTHFHFKPKHLETFKRQLLQWANNFNEVVWLDSNHYNQTHSSFEAILAVDAFSSLQLSENQSFKQLENYRNTTSDWIFGYLSYDLKNNIEKLYSTNFDGLQFPDLFFFQPKKVFIFQGNQVSIHYLEEFSFCIQDDLKTIRNESLLSENLDSLKLKIESRTSKSSYLEKVKSLQNHIHRGDIYEANFCQEFFSHGVIDPLATFYKLQNSSQPPFSAYLKNGEHFALSASPERYLKKNGNLVISQPIKGTSKRSVHVEEDEKLKANLEANSKERSENVMIVDLVRNDLSRIAEKGSVNVDELCGPYTFAQVHHLISTVSATIKEEYSSVVSSNLLFQWAA